MRRVIEGSPTLESSADPVSQRPARLPVMPYLTAGLASAGLITYAVTRAFVWDEGFHLIAAQLILAGKRPYLDFCFPQTPLNAYWNAGWMALFGSNWRVPHIAAALLMSATLFLLAHWTVHAFRESAWRSTLASMAVLLLATNLTVLQFGPIAQAYAMCMFCSFAAFLLVRNARPWRVALAGLLTGSAAASSLLSAAIAPVLAGWLLFRSRPGSRLRNTALYVFACAIPFVPVLWLFAQNPYQTFFNVVQYQALFRRINWGNANTHDADVLTAWMDSGSSLLALLLCIAGVALIRKLSGTLRDDLLLCLGIASASGLYISTAHPTFARYYIVAAPFFAVIACCGFLWTAERLFPGANPRWPAIGLSFLLLLAVGRFFYNERDASTWGQYESISAKVVATTPPHGSVFADEAVYFLLHWTPPPGMEFSYAHKLNLSPAEEAKLHIVSDKELLEQTKAGRFAVFETCNDDRIDQWHLDQLYQHRQDFDDCAVFWNGPQ